MNELKIKRALISVSDKTGILEFAKFLADNNVEIISTGGTAKLFKENKIPVTLVSDVTEFPEVFDGRVKTLHPAIHSGLLAVLDNPAHKEELEKLNFKSIDLLVVNLYPFEKTISNKDILLEEAIENIDIGGPAMLRAASKNFKFTVVSCNPNQYDKIKSELEKNNFTISQETRFKLSAEAFTHTAKYDLLISQFLNKKIEPVDELPKNFSLFLPESLSLRYGENPHQKGKLYGDFKNYFSQLHGKELSYNNILDISSAQQLVNEFSEPTVAIIKHSNPCGVGSANNLSDAFKKAFATDKKSPFGGIIAVNRKMDLDCANLINEIFTEVVIAPEFSDEVLELFKKKKDRRIILALPSAKINSSLNIRSVIGGVLIQTQDNFLGEDFKIVTNRTPTENEFASMRFAWRVAKNLHSNAIVYAREDRTLGLGAGQMSRVDSSKIAVFKAHAEGLDLKGCAVASDAFFPFADGLLEAISAGATAVVQPGGSIRDAEIIEAANQNNITMAFTGVRHFKH